MGQVDHNGYCGPARRHVQARVQKIVLRPTQRQCSLLLAKVEGFAERAKIATKTLGGEDPGLRLPAGVLVSLPGSEATTRGFDACTWLIIDEAARVPDALFYSARAYIATTNGRIVAVVDTVRQARLFLERVRIRPMEGNFCSGNRMPAHFGRVSGGAAGLDAGKLVAPRIPV